MSKRRSVYLVIVGITSLAVFLTQNYERLQFQNELLYEYQNYLDTCQLGEFSIAIPKAKFE